MSTLRAVVAAEGTMSVLVTGEPGTGKTWLWRRLMKELPASWRSVSIDMSEAFDPLEFLRLIGHGLGIAVDGGIGTARLSVASALMDEWADSRSWLLVIENAQDTPQQVWSEIQALTHGIDASSAFAAIILVGPTELARRLAMRPLTSLAARLAAHVHLLPLDFDEARELIMGKDQAVTADLNVLEELHRDAGGNPRRVLQLARRLFGTQSTPPLARQSAGIGHASNATAQPAITQEPAVGGLDSEGGSRTDRENISDSDRSDPLEETVAEPAEGALVPSRPPLRVEEGLVEVGWSGSFEAESAVLPTGMNGPLPSSLPPPSAEGELAGEEIIEDHYAALQAWTEWARNRGRAPEPPADMIRPDRVSLADDGSRLEAETKPAANARLPGGLRAEPQHEHAPYSQLFSRLRQSR
jgi:general secretion pathway protein A